jgi:hypothetical protein
MYSDTVACETVRPSFSSSPWILGAQSDRDGLLDGAHGDVSSAVRAGGAESCPAPTDAFQCHRASDRGRRGSWSRRAAWKNRPRYLIPDRDNVYDKGSARQAKTLDIREAVIAPCSPWQNACAERVIGSIRRGVPGSITNTSEGPRESIDE